MQEQGFERQRATSEERILTNFYGGLNTTAATINCPLEDSPKMLNMQVNDSGQLQKRAGTDLLYTNQESVESAYCTNMTTGLGYNFLIGKVGTSIRIFEVVNRVMTLIMTKTNVFSSAVAGIKPSTVRTNELEPRLILCTSLNKPVQLRFIEKSGSTAGANTSIIFSNATKFKNATTSNLIVFQNRVRVPGATVSYSSGNLTIGGLPVVSGTKTIDIVLVLWQWWAEATFFYGDRYWKGVTRFNATDTDRILSVPATISSDVTPLGAGYVQYPYFLYTNSTGSSYIKKTDGKPQTSTEWAHSDGSIYQFAASDYTNPSPFYVIFGAVFGSTPISVYFARRRELRFRNDTGLASGGNLDVYVNGVKMQKLFTGHSLTPVYGDVFMWKLSGSTIVACTSATDTVNFVSFETPNAGVATNSKVELVNTEVIHIGSAAVNTRYDFNDGSYVPAFGLGSYVDTVEGYYPGDCEIFQDRLVLSAFPHRPFTILFSGTTDENVPTQFFSFYQVTDDLLLQATDPFDLTIQSNDPKDFITRVVDWQNNLFVFTRYNCYKVRAVGEPTVTATSRGISLVTTLGALNKFCVAKTDRTLVFLSDTGVHALLDRENAEYQATELSLKIRQEFTTIDFPPIATLPWISYDTSRKELYVGIQRDNIPYVTRHLYVLNNFRISWTYYDSPGGFNILHGTEYVDRQLGVTFGCLVALHIDSTTNIPNHYGFLAFNSELYLDFANRVSNITNQVPVVRHTTADFQQVYDLKPTTTSSGFPIIPDNTVNDLFVTLAGVILTHNVDYVKIRNDFLYLRSNPGAGKSLVIKHRLPVTDSDSGRDKYSVITPVNVGNGVAIIDNVFDTNYLSYLLVDTLTTSTIVATPSPNVNSKVVYGLVYPAYFVSAEVLFEVITRVKRIKHIYLSFDNSLVKSFWTAADVNSLVPQEPGALIDVPKQRVNASYSLTLNDSYNGTTVFDLFRYPQLTWDDLLFDAVSSNEQFKQNTLFKIASEGTSYSFHVIVFNCDETTFRLNGLQLDMIVSTAGYAYKE